MQRPVPTRAAHYLTSPEGNLCLAALKGLVSALVSDDVPDCEVGPLLGGKPGCGDLIPAVLKARDTIRRLRL
jgi:hypothetical protein